MKRPDSRYRNVMALVLSLCGVLLLPASITFAQDSGTTRNLSPQVIFDQANSQLHQQKYAQALQLYHTIEKRSVESGPLYLNMALTYSHVDSMGMAKYYFMKAKSFPETRKAASEGLDYAASQLSHESAVLPKLPWERFMDNIRDGMGIYTFLAISLLLSNIGIIVLIASWFISKWKKYAFYSALCLLLIGILGISGSFYMQSRSVRYVKAVMVTRQDDVHNKPENNADVVSNAYEGYIFTVDKDRSQDAPHWYYIRMSNGQYGWISEKDIRIL